MNVSKTDQDFIRVNVRELERFNLKKHTKSETTSEGTNASVIGGKQVNSSVIYDKGIDQEVTEAIDILNTLKKLDVERPSPAKSEEQVNQSNKIGRAHV